MTAPVTAPAPARVAVFASGSGSNLQAILDHFASLGAAAPGAVVLVVSDRAGAFALERARRAGIAAVHVAWPPAPGALLALLDAHRIHVVALAGFLRLVPSEVTSAYRGCTVNIHPALLPAFGGAGMYGRRVHEAVLAAGVTRSGATVHLVNDEYDRGEIIARTEVPVEPDDTPDTLAARVLKAEHELYPRVVAQLCEGCTRPLPPPPPLPPS